MTKKQSTIESGFARLDRGWPQLDKLIGGLSEERAAQSPAPNEWSILHIIHHLTLTEQASTIYLKKKTQTTAPFPKINWRERFNRLMLRAFLVSPFKVKAPKPVQVPELPEGMTLASGLADWKKARAGMRALLESLPEQRFEEVVYRHPIFGRVSLDTMLDFMAYHQDRHFLQMKRVLTKLG